MLCPSFNSLGMPDWSFDQMVYFCHAVEVEYFEIRGLENTLERLTRRREGRMTRRRGDTVTR